MIALISTLLFLQINLYRMGNNLPYVPENQKTCEIANERLSDIKSNFTHYGMVERFNEKFDNSKQYGYENLGEYTTDDVYLNAQNILKMWQESKTHNKNLLQNITGFCVRTNGQMFVYEAVRE